MGDTIDSYIHHGVTLGSGTYSAPLTITQYGTIQYSAAGQTALFVPSGFSGLPIYNFGVVAGGLYGVLAQAGGTIINNAGATISAGVTGVYLNAAGTVINAGSIAGGTGGTGLFGHGYGNNSGRITGRLGVYFSGTFLNSGTILGGAANGVGLYMGGSAFADNSGTIYGTADGVKMKAGGTLVNSGTIGSGTAAVYFDSYAGPALLVADPGAVFNGRVAGTNVDSTIELASGASAGMLDMGGSFDGFGTIAIDTNAAWTLEGNASELAGGQVVTGFSMDDTLVLEGFTATSSIVSGDQLILSDGTALETLRITRTDPSQNFVIHDVAGGTQVTVCYAQGTRIATPGGEMAVEALRAGDTVVTANGPMTVRWIGRSDVCTRFADELRDLPVRIRAGALGDGLPRRDLLVSPQHALFLDGILVQAAALVDGVNCVRERAMPEFFSYYHVELDAHELLLAEGVWAESFVDNVDRRHFHNWDERETPDVPITELPYPRVKSARQLPAALRARLAA